MSQEKGERRGVKGWEEKWVCLEEGDGVEMNGGGDEKRQKMKTEKHLVKLGKYTFRGQRPSGKNY